ncbi:ChuX/HutX family heme-like substrate-binding protein [Aliamphritea spongicola]|nr:ChuX/HutX family heme-like substrate-binding protein [Aliamphritea spongicola]
MPLTELFTRSLTDSTLQQRFTQLMAAEPEIRRRDIAHKLEVSEAALIDQQCGVQSVRLNDQFADMIRAMPALGYIMTLTRNEYAVHERKGIYDNVRIGGPMGLVITEDRKIDLRIVLSRWAFGYAVREETARGDRFSLQFLIIPALLSRRYSCNRTVTNRATLSW